MTSGRPSGAPGAWHTAPGAGVGSLSPDELLKGRILKGVALGGLLVLFVGVTMFVLALNTGMNVLSKNAVRVPNDGQMERYELLADTAYGFYSTDTDLRCTVSAPDGTPVTITTVSLDGAGMDPPQILGFSSTKAGTYEVSCTGSEPVTINAADMTPERERAAKIWGISLPVIGLGAVVGLVGAVLFIRWRRRSLGVMVARIHGGAAPPAGPGSAQSGAMAVYGPWGAGPGQHAPGHQTAGNRPWQGAQEWQSGQSAAQPWQDGQPAPGGQVAPGNQPWQGAQEWQSGQSAAQPWQDGQPAPGGQVAPGNQPWQGAQEWQSGQPAAQPWQNGQHMPGARSAQSGPPIASAASAPDLGAPGNQGSPSGETAPGTPSQPPTSAGAYGIAPQQVVYRPLPPSDSSR